MLIKKSDRRRCHPCVAIAIGALAVIGAVSVTEKGKAWLASKMTRAKSLMTRFPQPEGCDDEC